jgi:hypothetical protein
MTRLAVVVQGVTHGYLITHNYGLIDTFFRKKCHDEPRLQVGKPYPLSLDEITRASKALSDAAQDIERRARAKFKLPA